MSRLRAVGEIREPNGLASSVLAKSVSYPGSSVAFAQLLSGMERDGLIEREIRGKRTYRIGLVAGRAAPVRGAIPAGGTAARAGGEREAEPAAHGNVAFDYDELARRLLFHVVWRITTAPDEGAVPDEVPAIGRTPKASGAAPGPTQADIVGTLVSLERKLASIQSRQRKLSAENARLREQLAAVQRSLAAIQDAGSPGGRLDRAERQVLERLLSSLNAAPARRQSAEVG